MTWATGSTTFLATHRPGGRTKHGDDRRNGPNTGVDVSIVCSNVKVWMCVSGDKDASCTRSLGFTTSLGQDRAGYRNKSLLSEVLPEQHDAAAEVVCTNGRFAARLHSYLLFGV